jgi:ACR3 family arsenite efflux pump ArsB
METFLGFTVEALRLIPLILAFYIPALIVMALIRERGEGYRVKAALVFIAGFGGIVALQLLLRSVSTLQAVETIGLSLVQVAVALLCAAFTVYKLAD